MLQEIKTAQISCTETGQPKQGVFKALGITVDSDTVNVTIELQRIAVNGSVIPEKAEIKKSFPISNPDPFLQEMFSPAAINKLIDYMTSNI